MIFDNKKNDFQLLYCLNCNNYPSFTKERPKEVLIQCHNCGYNDFYNLHNYLKFLKIKLILLEDQNIKCKDHHQIYNNYCSTCHSYICSQCKDHQSHLLISFHNNFQNKIIEGYNHLNNYCNELKSKKIKEYIFKLNQIEYSYNLFLSRNVDILQLMQIFITNDIEDNKSFFIRENELKNINFNLFKCNNNSKEGIINFFNQYTIINNSSIKQNENIKNTITIKENIYGVSSLFLLKDGRLVSCSHELITIYNMKEKYHLDITINSEKDNGFLDLCELSNGKLLSCLTDQSIKIWSISSSSYKCEEMIENAHNGWVYKVISLSNDRIPICSNDNTIGIRNSSAPYNCISLLNGHTNDVSSIICIKEKEILISGSYDETLRVWDLSKYQFKNIINNVMCWDKNSLIQIDSNRIVVGGGKDITIVNVNNYIIESKINNEKLNCVYSLMKLGENYVLCGCEEGIVCLCDILAKTIIKKIKMHDKHINDLLYLNVNHFISCSSDKTIKVWEWEK